MASSLRPYLVVADESGNIFDHPELLMVCRKGHSFSLPKPEDLIPLPEESELFLLPGRAAVGFNQETGEIEEQDALAVAAFAAPAHTLTAHPAYVKSETAPILPLFAYGAVGFANNRFYVCAKKVDSDQRQEFRSIRQNLLRKKAETLSRMYPKNRLVQHIIYNCTFTYACPAARNFCLGRYEAPLPISRTCNARCVGCISHQEKGSDICATPQSRLTFTPTPEEIVEIMFHHFKVAENPIYSFGQGCEGDPLTESSLIADTVKLFRERGGKGTININTNASLPFSLEKVVTAGISSVRVSLNSAREESYSRYYRPNGYTFNDVMESIRGAKQSGVYVSLNLLFFPGFTDTEKELESLISLIQQENIDCVQLRNLNIDPDMYLALMDGIDTGPDCGFSNFKKRLKKNCPWLHIGYFNPYVPDKKE